MKLLVTGRAGQLARSLAELVPDDEAIQLEFAARPDVDLAVPGSVARAIHAARPDVLVNAAAYTNVDGAEDEPELAFRINAAAAAEAATASAELGIPVVHISTDYVFDGAADRPYAETDPVNPVGVYGRSKAAGERSVADANPRHLILRTAWVYSPFGRNFVKTMLAAGGQRDRLDVVADQVGSPTSALELARGVLLAARAAHAGQRLGEVYHLAGSGETSWSGLAEQVMREARALGLPAAEISPIGTQDWPTRAVRPRNSRLDSGKFAESFGFRMPDWRQSVAAVVTRLAEAK